MHKSLKIIAALTLLWTAGAEAAVISGEKMQLPAKERKVDVTLFRAPGSAPRGSILILHGAGGFERQQAQYNAYAAAVANSGFDAYLVNYRSPADLKKLAAGEDVFKPRFVSWVRLVDDLVDVVKTAKGSNGKVGLIGFSDGGSIANGAAGMDKNVNAAVVYYGADAARFGIEQERFPPMLLLHGEIDGTITWMAAEELAQHIKRMKAPVEFVLFSGERHGFGSDITTRHGGDALKRTLTFFHKNMN